MTRGEIISMAMDAWNESGNGWTTTAWFHDRADAFEVFARKVEARAAAAEREACANVCDRLDAKVDKYPADCSAAIRARGAA